MKISSTLIVAIATLTALSCLQMFSQASSDLTIPAHVIEAYSSWQTKYGKKSTLPNEHKFRLANFYKNFLKVVEVNQSNTKWRAGLNKFSDLTSEEFKAKYLTKFRSIKPSSNKMPVKDLGQAPPTRLDWREKGLNHAIRNQGNCGSCWAFTSSFTVAA
jgi:C1A family cysteine protease